MGKLAGLDCNGVPCNKAMKDFIINKNFYFRTNRAGKSVASMMVMEAMIKSNKYNVKKENDVITFTRKPKMTTAEVFENAPKVSQKAIDGLNRGMDYLKEIGLRGNGRLYIGVERADELYKKAISQVQRKKKIEITPDYENGLKCSHMGVKTEDMDKVQLIEFIGQLDILMSNHFGEETAKETNGYDYDGED